jgi:hypothetical protein
VYSPDGSVGVEVDSSGQLALTVTPAARAPTANFSNNGVVLTGTLSVEIPRMPYGGTITGWTIVGDVAGDADITISHATYAAFPTITTLFTASISGAQKDQATGLSYPFSEGDVLRFSASSFANFTRCSITLDVS